MDDSTTPRPGGAPKIGEGRGLHEFRHSRDPPRELAERRSQQEIRLERIAMRPVEYEHRMHFAGRDPADIDI
jgi:hypothetical protein